MPSELLSIQPGELKFPFEVKKQISASLRLINSTDQYVAFKVKTTSPKKYCVRPNTGIVQPHSSAEVTVTMQAQREAPPDMQCKDKFLVQSVIAPNSEVTQEMFNKEGGNEVHEAKLKVLYVSPPQPPSPITETNEEEGNSPKAAAVIDNGDRHHILPDLTTKTENEWKYKLNETKASLSLLTEERNQAVQKCRALQQELLTYKSGNSRSGGGLALKDGQKSQSGFSFLFVMLVGLLGVLIGYLLGG
ncbi:vesicle-associated protein 1-2 [Physcomitrium patens]|uniref:MSP domain-containing protein n=1 Tax=Physcomitrium patens TaxID=3218 RepID=A9RI85_PHYPA|nr:vesicle-associated protein 1-2-like [Physcomitrium patens]XP_024362682.1 vesicle-associated protein 1-2-like [Physcomitrium patens]XP_024362683.1 vesicle-associated protein 1-2-like [Physcomitrium patens]PNR29096.1 hypothetical protein PHYPA_027788 [Physcomitrium patens]|eukprot:XP_024362681.1 vesicle-associated protein 1-2-like [Physcomitrella patens]